MTPGQAIKLIADVFETPEVDVENYDRKLAEANLRTATGGRGSSAPHVTEHDLVRLTLATLLVRRPIRTIDTVTEWWSLPNVTRTLDGTTGLSDEQLSILPPRVREALDDFEQSFGETLAALLADCVESDLTVDFAIKIVPQDKHAEIRFFAEEVETVLAFQGGLNTDDRRPKVLTEHWVFGTALMEIAKAFRGG